MTIYIVKIVQLSVLVIMSVCVKNIEANWREFFEQAELENMFHVLGPKNLLTIFLNKTSVKIIPDGACKTDLLSYVAGLERREIWALKSKYILA